MHELYYILQLIFIIFLFVCFVLKLYKFISELYAVDEKMNVKKINFTKMCPTQSLENE